MAEDRAPAPNTRIRLGRIIADRREALRMKQVELARMVNVYPARIWRIENGAANISIDELLAILAALQWSMHTLATMLDIERQADIAKPAPAQSPKDKALARLVDAASSMTEEDIRLVTRFTRSLSASFARHAAR